MYNESVQTSAQAYYDQELAKIEKRREEGVCFCESTIEFLRKVLSTFDYLRSDK